MKRKSRVRKIVVCLLLAFCLLFCNISSPAIIAFASIAPSQSEIERPDSLEQGLSRKSYDEILGKRVTIRQPQMKILATGLKRQTPKVMPDTFNLPDFSTGEITDASIHFTKYPGMGQSKQTFSAFEKYMLLREVFWYNQNAMEDAADGTLMKHPAADSQYGAVEGTDNAVKKWILTDPEYKSPMTTGLYLAPGEVATVTIAGLKSGQSVTLYTHHQSTMGYAEGNATQYFAKYDKMIIDESKKEHPDYESLPISLNGQYNRQNEEIPAMGATFVLDHNGEFKIGCPFGGVLYVNPTASPTEITIEGAVETPHFILGVTTVDEFNSSLRNAPGLFATLDCENGQLIGPSSAMRNCDDIEKLAYFWHSVFAVNASFNGRAYNYNITLSFDTHVPAGSAVALSSDRAAHPKDWFNTCMNYGKLTTAGLWGVFHELGHVHANAYGSIWGMREEKEGEVRNNTLIIIIYTMLCNMDSRVISVEHGEFTHPYTTQQYIKKMQANRVMNDYRDGDYFDMLSMYSSLIHYFSPESFVDFLYTYNLEKNYCPNPRADFVYRIATVTNMNITKWLNRVYKANIDDTMFTSDQLTFLSSLKDFYPIAYKYANGTNGFETARKHEVDYIEPTTFDFSGDNILCPVNFEIISYKNPLHGTIQVSDDLTKVVYTPPQDEIVESDEFAVRVRIKSTGVDVYLPVRFNFSYRSSTTKVWDEITPTRDVAKAKESVKDLDPSYTEVSSTPGKARYTAGVNAEGKSFYSYLESKFKFIATSEGTHSFYTNSDDSSIVYFYKDNALSGSLTINGDRSKFDPNSHVDIFLRAGETVTIESNQINFGGLCYLNVGVKFPDSTDIVSIPKENMLHYNLTSSQLEQTKDFGWKPKFFVSIKNAFKTTAATKDGWQVLEAPLPQGDDETKNAIVDGNNSTIFHSRWNYAPKSELPHIFVIDTTSIQNFNYFEIITRSNPNSFIKKMNLYGSTDNTVYDLLYSTESLVYENLKATIEFNDVQVRFFKIEVFTTSGANGGQYFTVIAEVNAGLKAKMEQPIKPSTFETEKSGFTEDYFGELRATEQDSTFTFDFVGIGFDIFANTSADMGSASIKIDGQDYGTIDLSGERTINRVVFSVRELINKEHTVVITTLNDKEFHIAFINVEYGVDTGEVVEPAPAPSNPQVDEHFVGGHTWDEEVKIELDPDMVTHAETEPTTPPESSPSTTPSTHPTYPSTPSSPEIAEGAPKKDNFLIILGASVVGAVVLSIGLVAILKVATPSKKNKK